LKLGEFACVSCLQLLDVAERLLKLGYLTGVPLSELLTLAICTFE